MAFVAWLLLLVHFPVDGQLPSIDLEGGVALTWFPLFQREMQFRSADFVRALERLGPRHVRQAHAGRVHLDGGAAHEPESSIGLEAPGAINVSPLSDERRCRSRRGGSGRIGLGLPIAGAATEQQRERCDAEECGIGSRRHFDNWSGRIGGSLFSDNPKFREGYEAQRILVFPFIGDGR